MRQLSKLTLTAINQVLRDLYSKLTRVERKSWSIEKVALSGTKVHYNINTNTENIVTVTECNFRIVDGRTLRIAKPHYHFKLCNGGYRCMTSVHIPNTMIDGDGHRVNVSKISDQLVEFSGDVPARKPDVYLYPIEHAVKIIRH